MGSERNWFVQLNGNIQGPLSSPQLKQLADESKITPETLIRLDVNGNWVNANKIKGLFSPQRSLAEIVTKDSQVPSSMTRPAILVPQNAQIQHVTTISTSPIQSNRAPCPFCGEDIITTAIKCRHCNEFLDGRPRVQPQQVTQQITPPVFVAPPVATPNINVAVNQQTNVYIPSKRWSRLVAIILSFLIPGLGQLYKGQPINGLVWFKVVVVGYIALIIPGLVLHLCCILGAGMGDPYR